MDGGGLFEEAPMGEVPLPADTTGQPPVTDKEGESLCMSTLAVFPALIFRIVPTFGNPVLIVLNFVSTCDQRFSQQGIWASF